MSSAQIVEAAETVTRTIVDTYLAPNKTFLELRELMINDAMDPFRTFSEACRGELRLLGPASPLG